MTSTEHDPIDDLRMSVKTLTQWHQTSVTDKHDAFLGIRQEKPLLMKLEESIASSAGGAGTAGALASHRSLVNAGAFDLHKRISDEVHEWYGRETDYTQDAPKDTTRLLQQWYIRFVNRYRLKQIPEDLFVSQARQVDTWTVLIRDLLDPPFRFPLTSPCPACGQEWVERYAVDDPAEIERVRVLNAVERERIEDSYVMCAGCDKVWRGVYQARQLRILIDDAEAAKIA